MAEDSKPDKPTAPAKKAETVRQRTERVANEAGKPKNRRINKTAGVVSRPFRSLHRFGKREYYLPLPDNKAGRFLNKRRSIVPKFFGEAWRELRRVEWPNNKLTVRLTFAVFAFAIVFGTLIAIVDYGLDKVFKKVFLS